MNRTKGVISKWRLEDGRIKGILMWRSDMGHGHQGLTIGQPITTSPIVDDIVDGPSWKVVETRNSTYFLIDKEV